MAPDLRGHGDSAWAPDGDYTIPLGSEEEAARLRATLAQLGVYAL